MCGRKMTVSVSLGILYGVLGLILSGCISGRSDVQYGPEGPAVGHETTRQIEIGQTSKEWVLGTFGKPATETATPEGTEILKYVYTKKVDSDLDVFLFLDFDEKHEYRTTFYFEIADGVVTKFWKE